MASSRGEEPPLSYLVTGTREALARVVNQLVRQEHTLQRQAREAIRRLR